MAEAEDRRFHRGLLLMGLLFILLYIAARYYIVWVLLPQGALTSIIVTVRDSILQIGLIVAAASLILPSTGLKKDEETIAAYVIAPAALFLILGLDLHALKSPLAIYMIYNAGGILTVVLIAVALSYLGFRGKRVDSQDADRIAMAALAFTLVLNTALFLWIFSNLSSGKTVPINLDILHTHSLRYTAWTVLAVFLMKFSTPVGKLRRLVTLALAASSILWTLTYAGYSRGIPIQIVSGVFDVILGASFLVAALLLWGLKGKRGPITPHLAVGSIAFIWLLIAGAVGLYLIATYSVNGQPVPAGLRVFHLINANWSFTAGLAALALASIKPSKLGWVTTLLFAAGFIQAMINYTVNITDPQAATALLNLGEPFLAAAFLTTIYQIRRPTRQTTPSPPPT